MLSESDIEAAHPEAFDFVFGNLPQAKRDEFNRHLTGCRYCQAVVDEYSEIGGIIKQLPPHVEPPADLEDRTVDAVVQALAEQRSQTDRRPDAEDQAATRLYQLPQPQPSAEPETRVMPRPQLQPQAEPQARTKVTPLPWWRRHPRQLAAVVAVAAAIVVAAVIVIPRLSAGPGGPVVTVSLHATTAAKLSGEGTASGQVVARPSGPSWTFTLSVRGLKVLSGNDVYECWWALPGSTKAHPMLVSGGTFVVDNSGATIVTMTSGVDARQFSMMEITAESPGNGASHGATLLVS